MTNIPINDSAQPGNIRSRKRVTANLPLPAPFAFNPEDLRLFIKYVAPRRRIDQMHIDWRADLTLIEDADLGRGIAQDLRRTSTQCKPLVIKPRIEKLARMQARSVMFETGRVFFPRDAPWLSTYVDELLGFPNRAKDDQVDSTSQALEWLQHRFASDFLPEGEVRKRPSGRKRPKGVPQAPGSGRRR